MVEEERRFSNLNLRLRMDHERMEFLLATEGGICGVFKVMESCTFIFDNSSVLNAYGQNITNISCEVQALEEHAVWETGSSWVSGQCTQYPALCCKGVDSSCRRGDCYCDSYCTTNYDCCSDYTAACNGVTQAPPTPPAPPAPPAPPIAADVPVQALPETTLAATTPQSTTITTTTTMTTPTIGITAVTKNVALPLNASQTTTTAIQSSSMGPAVVTSKPGNASTAVSTSVSQPVGSNTTSSVVQQGQQAATGSNPVSQISLTNATTVTTGQMVTTTLLGTPPNKTSNASQSTPTAGPATFPPTGSGNVSVFATAAGANQTNTTSTVVSVFATATVANQTNTTSTVMTTLKNPNITQATIQGITSTVTPTLSILISAATTTAQLNNINGTGVTGKDPATGSPTSAPLATSNQSTASGLTGSQSLGMNFTTVASVQMATTTLPGAPSNQTSTASPLAPSVGPGTFSTSGPGQVSAAATSTGANQTNTASPVVTTSKNPNITQGSILGNASAALTALFASTSAASTTAKLNNTNGTGVTWKDPATVSLISGPATPSNLSATSGPTVSQVSFLNSSTLATVQMVASTMTTTSPNKTANASQPTPTASPGAFSTIVSGNMSVAATSAASNQTNTTSQAVTMMKSPNITQSGIQANTSAVPPTSSMLTFAAATTVQLSNTSGAGVTGKDPSTASLISAQVVLSNQSTSSAPTGPQLSVMNVTTVAATQIVATTLPATSLNTPTSTSQSMPPATPGTSTTSGLGMSKTVASSGTNQTNTSTANMTEFKSPNTVQANASSTPTVWSILISGATTQLNTNGTGTTGKDPATGQVISAPVALSNQSTTSTSTGPQSSGINATTVTTVQMAATTLLGTPPNNSSNVSQSIPTAGPGTFSTANAASPVATAFKSPNTTIQTNTSAMPPALSMPTSSAATTTQLNNTNGTGVTGKDPGTWSLISATGASSNQSTTPRATGPQDLFVNATTVAIAQVVATTFTENASQSVPTKGPGTFPTPGAGQESRGANQSSSTSPPVTAFNNISIAQANTSAVPAASSALSSTATITTQLNKMNETQNSVKDSSTASLTYAGGSNQSTPTLPTGLPKPAVNLTTQTTSSLNVSKTTAVIPDNSSSYTISVNSPTGGTPNVEQHTSSAPLYTGLLTTRSSNTNQTTTFDSKPAVPTASLSPTTPKQREYTVVPENDTTMNATSQSTTAAQASSAGNTMTASFLLISIGLLPTIVALSMQGSSPETGSVTTKRTTTTCANRRVITTETNTRRSTTRKNTQRVTTARHKVKKSQVITLQLTLLRNLPIMSILEIENQLLEKVRTFIKEKFPNVTISASMRIKEKRILRFTAS
ncbi:uncharacterized protein LOC144790706 [Lissotriton helveticus]